MSENQEQPPRKPGSVVENSIEVDQENRIVLPADVLAYVYVSKDPETGFLRTHTGITISLLTPADQLVVLATLEEATRFALNTRRGQLERQAETPGGTN